MVYSVKVTESAERDLDEIVGYIVQELCNPQAAAHLLDEIGIVYLQLARTPESPEAKESLTEFWSHMLESQVFYAFPMEFFMMCTERGLYEASQRKIKAINTALDKIETGSEFDAVYRSMMNDEYQKLAAPHEGAYHMHLNEILFNMSEFLEMWAKENVEVNKKKHARMLSEMIEKTAQEDKERFMRSMGMEEGPEDTTSYD